MTTPTLDHPERATRLLDALLSSASVEEIGAAYWWDRAKTALETAVAAAESWPHLVSVAARKLQIDTLSERSSRQVTDLEIADPAVLAEFCETVRRDAVYIVALTRVGRQGRTRKAA